MNLTDTVTIKHLAQKYGIKPSALSGQNFLVDKNILARIVAAAAIRPGDNVLEIGPGFGVLTECLLAAGAKVLAVEKDRRLAKYLASRFGHNPLFDLLAADILTVGNRTLDKAFSAGNGSGPGGSYRLISNLPYRITGKTIKKFVSDTDYKPEEMLVLLQKEVAERICAKPGQLSLLAIAVQLYAKPQIEFLVSKNAFWPVPKVNSALVKICGITSKTNYPIKGIEWFWRVLRIGFSSPRKQIHNNLTVGLGIEAKLVRKILDKLNISAKARPQELTIEQWTELTMALDT